ncbi:hypothetical protein NBRGN_098_01350 [Nocardia brasiliensis NBRC 14402]|uniref:hypothetical protein n=1 Tax=Nocardia brasiliensis TaxID=37326 RepID=UPI0002FDC382|nr:hypothetical protein [Nocardia brasiliensis]ASF08443.1 hypothetical protein CEQ30_14930 [Nocardia brasiliensis]GAJ85700.1 hypothetical protein NBRGN_098_01350 [Nocardia brasiliensis NBRC 14402]SUB41077.1 Uncharacterised protein [Nocardia brasiliensis]
MSNHTSERHRLGRCVDRYGPPSSQDRTATAVTETIVMPWPMDGLGGQQHTVPRNAPLNCEVTA